MLPKGFNMVTKEIPINKGQYLADVYPLIESNIILNKRLSGVGATHCEIIAPRNSIIVVPNVPIITCKVEKHKDTENLFGVDQYVKEPQIIRYLEKTKREGRNIKIMVTPESFHKVRRAFEETDLNIYDSCFLMLDECHKFVKERDFRKDITNPFLFFFKFKNKALVSATPIYPTDPRFKEQNFLLVKVIPQNFSRFEITIVPTNDIRRAFFDDRRGTSKDNLPDEPQCIFVNSTKIIEDLIIQSNLEEFSSIFCSELKAVELKGKGFKNVHIDWKPEYETKFMFFTSRFYTGLDILLNEQPRVLYFSDAEHYEQTLMDPFTDMAQACGRFRNGMKEIFHYVVFNEKTETLSDKEIEDKIKTIEKAYKALDEIYAQSKTTIEKTTILNLIHKLDFSEIYSDGEIDYFLKDNWIEREKVKSYYSDPFKLMEIYSKSEYFQMPWMDNPHIYPLDLTEFPKLKKISSAQFKKEQNKAIIETLENISPYLGTSEINDIYHTLQNINKTLVEAYFKLGSDFIKDSKFNMNKIKEVLSNHRQEKIGYDEAFFEILYNSFEIGKKYRLPDAKKKLQRIYDKFNLIPPTKITAKSLEWYFEIRDTARIGNAKAIEILRPKVQGVVDYYQKIKNNT